MHRPALVRASFALANAASEFGEVKTSKENVVDGGRTEGDNCVRRFDNCLHYGAETAAASIAATPWHAHTPLALGNLGTLQFDVLSPAIAESTWIVRQRQGGERIQFPGRQQDGRPYRHALKDILQQLRVPPWHRNNLIILLFPDTHELACVVGICASARFQDWLDRHATRLVHNN